jgi:hypothetical protein
MADLSITEAEVVPTTNTNLIKYGKAASAIAVGAVVYKLANGTIGLADADNTSTTATACGIAISAAEAANQRVAYQTGGTLTVGASASIGQGTPYFLSGTAGSMCPDADLAEDDYCTYIGFGGASNTLVMPNDGPHASGVQHPA